MGFVARVVINAFAIVLAAAVLPGMEIRGLLSALGAGLVLGLVNALVRPVLLILTLPLTLVTLGLFLFILNGVCLWLTSLVVTGFELAGFWSAVFGAILVSLVSWLLTVVLSDRGRVVVIRYERGQEIRRPPRPPGTRALP